MRVTAGSLKNRILASPQGSQVRPTSDKVRSALFSSLAERVIGATFLDLFAGTGAVGIEAYSRGAKFITFADKYTKNLTENVKLLPKDAYEIISGDIFSIRPSKAYDIIFVDPPYGVYSTESILAYVNELGILAPGGIIATEDSSRSALDPQNMPFSLLKERKYGDTVIRYWEYS